MRIRSAWSIVLTASVLVIAAGCSRENQDWRSAQAADTSEAYDDFAAKHPQSEFAAQAKSRVKQLAEERDWERSTVADTAEAYQQFLAQHPDGKWAQEARVRIENFNVIDGAPKPDAAAAVAAPAKTVSTKQATVDKATPAKPALPAAPDAVPKGAAALKPMPTPKPAPAVKTAATPKPVSVPKPAAVVKASVAGHHIQLGAFSNAAKADAEWARVSGAFGELKGLASHVVAAQTAAGKLYRLQVAVPSEERGRALCKALAARKQACVYVRAT